MLRVRVNWTILCFLNGANEMEFYVGVYPASGLGQDRAIARNFGSTSVFVLADGAGGGGGGEVAADHVISQFDKSLAIDENQLVSDIATVDNVILKDSNAGETTCVVVSCTDGHLIGGSVGDSEAWIVKPDDVIDLTQMQSRKPLLGSGDANVQSFRTNLRSGVLVIASDGLVNYAPFEKILECIRQTSGKLILPNLVDLTRLRSGALQDDVSIIIAYL